jgi:hypothetical protein
MKDYLDSILTPLITDERKEVLIDCVVTLEHINYETAIDEIQQVCEIQSGISDNAMLLSRLDDVIHYAHNQIFIQHNLVVSTEATQEQRQAIVKALTEFDHYIIPDQIVLLMGGQHTNEEIIAHMVPMFTRLKFDQIIDYIQTVDDVLIQAIARTLEARMAARGAIEAPLAPVSRIRLINRVVARVGRERFSMVFDLSDAGLRVGAAIDNLYQLAVDGLDRLDPAAAAYEIFGLVLFSDVPLADIANHTNTLITDYQEDTAALRTMQLTLKPVFALLGEYANETA